MTNKLVLNNRTFGVFKTSQLKQLNIISPDIQRIIDNQKVESIVDYQLEHLKTKNCTNFIGVINIHHYLDNKGYYLTDGQHRYEALKRLLDNHSHDIETVAEIISVDNLDELRQNYNIINLNTSLPDFSIDIDKNIPEKTSEHFQNKYPCVWSKKARTKRPHIYFNHFQETLGYLTEQLQKHGKITDHIDLIDIIDKRNNTLLDHDFTSDKFKDVSLDMYNKAHKWKFVLGLFPYTTNQEYGYYWAKQILKEDFGISIETFTTKKRKGIPKKVKNDSWDKYIGNDVANVFCLVCNVTKINQKDFEAGHIIADSCGGSATIDNILPVCRACNTSMGSTEMSHYIKEHYPLNISNFINKQYNIPPPIQSTSFISRLW